MIDLFRPVQRRSGLANPDGWLVDMFGGLQSKTGLRITADTALAVSSVYACVQVRANTLAALPLQLFQLKSSGDRVPAVKHPLYSLMASSPHPELTSYEWREMMSGHTDLRGNSYAQIVRDRGGRIRRLTPLHPDRVTPRRSGTVGRDGIRPMFYEVANPGFGGMIKVGADEMLHVRDFGGDGIVGYSRIRVACESIGIAMAADEHAARMFSNGASPVGVLQHPNKLGDAGRQNLRKSWNDVHGGVANSGKIAILEEGMTFQEIGLSNEDAQLLESRKFSRTEIASIFRVPPHMIGDLERATFANIEQQSIEFVVYCMLPVVTRWEQRMNLSLLSAEERGEFEFSFNLAGLMRGDMASRYNAYMVGRQNGWLSANDIRESEGMNRIKGGDTYLTPLNMTTQANRAAIEPILADAIGRAFRKEAKAVRAIVRKDAPDTELETFYADHRRYLAETLAPVHAAAGKLGVEIPDPVTIARALAESSLAEVRAARSESAEIEDTFLAWETTRAAATAARLIAQPAVPAE